MAIPQRFNNRQYFNVDMVVKSLGVLTEGGHDFRKRTSDTASDRLIQGPSASKDFERFEIEVQEIIVYLDQCLHEILTKSIIDASVG